MTAPDEDEKSSRAKETVVRAQGPFLTLLVDCWTGLLHDFAVLTTRSSAPPPPPPQSSPSRESSIDDHDAVVVAPHVYRLALYGKAGGAKAPVLSSGIGPSLRRAWPAALTAASATLVQDRTVAYGAPGKERHAALLDISLAASHWAGNDAERTCALTALQRLTSHRFLKDGWVGVRTMDECLDVVVSALASRHVVVHNNNNNTVDQDDGRSASPSVLEAAAAVLEQLSAALAGSTVLERETQDRILSAAKAFVEARGASTRVLDAALHAMIHQFAAAASVEEEDKEEEEFILAEDRRYTRLVYVCAEASLGVCRPHACSTTEQLSAASAHMITIVRIAASRPSRTCLNARTSLRNADTSEAHAQSLRPEQVIASALATAVAQAEEILALSSSSDSSDSFHGGGNAEKICWRDKMRANVTCMLALGAIATDPGVEDASTQVKVRAETESRGGGAETGRGGELSVVESADEEEEDDDDWTGTWEEAGSEAVAASASPAQQLCLATLEEILRTKKNIDVRLGCLEAVNAALQRLPPPQWAALCASACLPSALSALHETLLRTPTGIQDLAEMHVASESLKLGVLCCNLGGDMGGIAMRMVVPVMVECATPAVPPPPAQFSLAQEAVKLLMSLGSGSGGSDFRATVASLPEGTKKRLQLSLASVANSAGASGTVPGKNGSGAHPAGPRVGHLEPSIQLRRFGNR